MILRARGREVTRLEALSDGIFAFSATLLVVSLEVPRTFAQLLDELSGFVAFGLSFGALILIWSVHNGFFRRYGLQDGWTTLLNGCLLFVVLFYVYPLKFMSHGFAQSVLRLDGGGEGYRISIQGREMNHLFMLYGAGFVAIFACVTLLYGHAYRRRDALELTGEERREAAFYSRHYFLFVLVGLVSVGLAAIGAGIRFGFPGWIYGAIGPLCWAHAVWTRRREESAAGNAPS
jgi:uncharacterized membrane protein